MRNSEEHPAFNSGRESEEREGNQEQAGVFSEAGYVGPDLESDDGYVPLKNAQDLIRLKGVREELSAVRHFAVPPEFKDESAVQSFFSRRKTERELGGKAPGRFRRWLTLGLASLGILGGTELQAEDLKAPTKTASGGVPVYKASAQESGSSTNVYSGSVPVFKAQEQRSGASTNVYNYKQDTWKPVTPEEKERAAKAKERLDKEKNKPSFTVTAAPDFNKDAAEREKDGAAQNKNVSGREAASPSIPGYVTETPQYGVNRRETTYGSYGDAGIPRYEVETQARYRTDASSARAVRKGKK